MNDWNDNSKGGKHVAPMPKNTGEWGVLRVISFVPSYMSGTEGGSDPQNWTTDPNAACGGTYEEARERARSVSGLVVQLTKIHGHVV